MRNKSVLFRKGTIKAALPILFFAALALSAAGLNLLEKPKAAYAATPAEGFDISWYGSGSASAFTISTAEQMAGFAMLSNSVTAFLNKTVTLTADIDLSAYGAEYDGGKGWTPVGSRSSYFFRGAFDGNNKKITGLYINNENAGTNTGLFGTVTVDGVVKNLSVSGDIRVSSSINICAGGIAGYLNSLGGSITNCSFTGTVTGTNISQVGGIAGASYGSIKNCYFNGAVSGGGSYIGGIVGDFNRTNATDTSGISDCYSAGSVYGGSFNVGGIVGYTSAPVSRCYSVSSVDGNAYVGGIAGNCNTTGTTIANCAALNLSVRARNFDAGRILGYNPFGLSLSQNVAWNAMTVRTGAANKSIDSGPATSDGSNYTSADINAGVGTIGGRFVTGWNYTAGKLPGFGKPIGMAGHLVVPGTSSAFDGGAGTSASPYEISRADQLAWLATVVNDGTHASYNYTYKLTGSIDLSGYGKNALFNSGKGWLPIGINRQFRGVFNGGGNKISGLYINDSLLDAALFGCTDGAAISNLGVTGADINNNNAGASSTAGVLAGYAINSSIKSCYVTGAVRGRGGDAYVSGFSGAIGGVAGGVATSAGVISDCYSSAEISGVNDYAGGIAGYNAGSITNCYSTGAVSGRDYVGGIAGFVSYNATVGKVTNCAALNPNVKSNPGVNAGRVAGNGGGALAGNRAFNNLRNNSGGTGWSHEGAADIDGSDASNTIVFGVSFWTSASNWNSAAWDEASWTFENYRLPVLNGAGKGQTGVAGEHIKFNIGSYYMSASPSSYAYTGGVIYPSDINIPQYHTLPKSCYDIVITSGGVNPGTAYAKVTVKDNSNFSNPIPSVVSYTITAASGAALSAPALLSKTATSITVNAVAAPSNGQTVEYARNTANSAPGSGWQSGTTFTGLIPGTTYYIFARAASSNTYNAGTVSPALTVTTAAAPTVTTEELPGGTVGTAYSQTLAASGDGGITWSLETGKLPDGLTLGGNGNVSGTPLKAGAFDFTVKAVNGAGSNTKAFAITVAAAAGAAVSAPALISKTANSVTVSVSSALVSGQAVEYAISTSGAAPAEESAWSVSFNFTELDADTTYYIFARAAADADHGAGAVSAALEVTTGSAPLSPVAVAAVAAAATAVVLIAVYLIFRLAVKKKKRPE